jgi:hypothetical protein
MKNKGKFKSVKSKIDFIELEHEILAKWNSEKTFNQLREKNSNSKPCHL